MKKVLLVILAVLTLLCCLAGCGASIGDMASSDIWTNSSKSEATAPGASTPTATPQAPTSDSDSGVSGGTAYASEQSGGAVNYGQAATDLAAKIIYTAYASVETVSFDESVNRLYDMLGEYGAFLESSDISGASYYEALYGYQTYRRADFVIRVPRESFDAMTLGLSELGNVVHSGRYSENITERYSDAESRLSAYRIEEERLLAMLEKAETVEDMLTIESRLSEVRYEIEALVSSLRNWDNEVAYSTVTLTLSEVEELSEQVAIQRTYWQELGDGLRSTFKGIGRFFKNLFRDIVVALPVLAVIVVVIVLLLLLLRPALRRRAARRAQRAGDMPPEGKKRRGQQKVKDVPNTPADDDNKTNENK